MAGKDKLTAHSTNYTSTFIEVADDCAASGGTIPPEKKTKTIARMQYDMINARPYAYTSDEALFAIHAVRNKIGKAESAREKEEFFSKGKACLRSSPLSKTYGWGIHFDEKSKIALYGKETEEYARFQKDERLNHLKAMKNSK